MPRIEVLRDGGSRQRFEFRLSRVEPARCAGPHTLLLSYYGPRQIIPGQRWRFHSKLKRPWGLANPGSFNMQSWYAQTGIDALGNIRPDSAQLLATAFSELQGWEMQLPSIRSAPTGVQVNLRLQRDEGGAP